MGFLTCMACLSRSALRNGKKYLLSDQRLRCICSGGMGKADIHILLCRIIGIGNVIILKFVSGFFRLLFS